MTLPSRGFGTTQGYDRCERYVTIKRYRYVQAIEIHTNNFVLVDKEMRIRGYYDGISCKEVDRLIREVDLLLNQ
jgi:cytochrome oxidase Cu insertion factor (SCO1/SenC/PrrC family)